MFTTTLLYAGILGIISLALSAAVGGKRGSTGVSVGVGDDKDLLVATRRHANFVEYVPLALILMALLEANGVSTLTIHIFGVALTVARICHPLGLSADNMSSPLRFIGAAGTFLLTAVMSVWAIVVFF